MGSTEIGHRRAMGIVVGALLAVITIAAALLLGEDMFSSGHERSHLSAHADAHHSTGN
jgi:hypothetical protein